MAKMGISTLRSYKGAQIADAIGLGKEFFDEEPPSSSCCLLFSPLDREDG